MHCGMGNDIEIYYLEPQEGRDTPVSRATRPGKSTGPKREENAQVEDPYGREEALQQDWYRQDQAGPDEDASHPYFEGTKDQAEIRQDGACVGWRLQEGSAHDSLRLIAAPAFLREGALPGPKSNPRKRTGPPASRIDGCREIQD